MLRLLARQKSLKINIKNKKQQQNTSQTSAAVLQHSRAWRGGAHRRHLPLERSVHSGDAAFCGITLTT